MELSQEQQKLYRLKLLQTFKNFIDLCNKHNIKYIGAYGTVLGAVRHNGLIPWDDDIDVYMFREDYEKFLALKKELDNKKYYIIDKDNKGYYLPFAKFCDANTTIWERKDLPFTIGVFIDVFPLDDVDESISQKLMADYSHYFSCYFESVRTISYKEICHPRNLLRHYWQRCLYSISKNKIISSEQAIKAIHSEKCMCYMDFAMRDFNRGVLDKKIFKNTILHKFENIEIQIPADYDGYLTQEYGDYMTPPSPEKRISQHYHYFIDLEHGYTLEECKEIIRNMDPKDLEQKDLSYLIE